MPGASGKHYKWIDLIAIVWVGIITILFLGPIAPTGIPWKDGFNWDVANYAPLTVGGALILFGGWWLISAKNWFKGPVRMGTAEELEQMEERTATAFEVPADTGVLLVETAGEGRPAGRPSPSHPSSARRKAGSAAVRSMRSKCSAA